MARTKDMEAYLGVAPGWVIVSRQRERIGGRRSRWDAGRAPYPPLEGEGRSRAARAGWGDLSTRAVSDVERPSPHPVSHFAALNVSRPSPSRGG
ncbi:hypothetical protein XH89_05280 [Bradyrhizobium sp. CCBAU 53340]|nr:hypothetical protein XH89_05280 [Bradyrhizobium sp. CCBAU 53340]